MHLPDIYDDNRQDPQELLWGDDEPASESESESESEQEQEESDDDDGEHEEGDLGECYDIDLDGYGNKITDEWGDGCDEYAQNLHWCGQYNTDAFQSDEMCCACGGGDHEVWTCFDDDNNGEITDNWGDNCEAYTNNPHWCHQYDSEDFLSGDLCQVCGGGACAWVA